MIKKNIGLALVLMMLSGVVVAAGSAAFQPRTGQTADLDGTGSPNILALPLPVWDAVEQFSPFFVGTSLVSIGALLRIRRKRGPENKATQS